MAENPHCREENGSGSDAYESRVSKSTVGNQKGSRTNNSNTKCKGATPPFFPTWLCNYVGRSLLQALVRSLLLLCISGKRATASRQIITGLNMFSMDPLLPSAFVAFAILLLFSWHRRPGSYGAIIAKIPGPPSQSWVYGNVFPVVDQLSHSNHDIRCFTRLVGVSRRRGKSVGEILMRSL
jgi:hypothetical protein